MSAQAAARTLVTGKDDAGADTGAGEPDDVSAGRPGAPAGVPEGAGPGGRPAGPLGGNALSQQARLTIWVRGRVQGVGFRWWIRINALELGLVGAAENLVDGRVRVVAEGNRDNCAVLLERLESPGTPGNVVQVTHRWDQARGGMTGFVER
jgi:acylphosphatase